MDRILTAVASLAHGGCACCALADPLDATLWDDVWLRAARANTRILNAVFSDIMQDSITTMAQWAATDGLPPANTELLAALVGKLAVWPKAFLAHEDLTTRVTEVANLLPSRVTQ